MRKIRYIVARFLIHLGLDIMPEGAYKTQLLDRLWGLYYEVQEVLEQERAKNDA